MTLSNPAQYISGRTVQEQMNSLIDYVDQRATDVALDAIASDVAQVHQDMLDADADAAAAAASAAAAAGTLTNAVKKTGEASQSIAGDIAVAGTLSGGVVTGTRVTVPTPTNNTDAATKKYVDDADALKLNITDVNNYAVGLTGNQIVSGLKGITNYLDLLAGAVEMRLYDNANRDNMIAGFGVRYRTAISTNAAIKSYAPKANPSDPSEVQRGGFLQVVSNRDGTISLNIHGTKADGTTVVKVLAYFDGTSWS